MRQQWSDANQATVDFLPLTNRGALYVGPTNGWLGRCQRSLNQLTSKLRSPTPSRLREHATWALEHMYLSSSSRTAAAAAAVTHPSYEVPEEMDTRPEQATGCSECGVPLWRLSRTEICSGCGRSLCWWHFGFGRALYSAITGPCMRRGQLHLCNACHHKVVVLRSKHRQSVIVLETGLFCSISTAEGGLGRGRLVVDFDTDELLFRSLDRSETRRYSMGILPEEIQFCVEDLEARIPLQRKRYEPQRPLTVVEPCTDLTESIDYLFRLTVAADQDVVASQMFGTDRMTNEQLTYLCRALSGVPNAGPSSLVALFAEEEDYEVGVGGMSMFMETQTAYQIPPAVPVDTYLIISFESEPDAHKWMSSAIYLATWAKFSP